MDRYSKLRNNTILFALGSFGSTFITFVMLPLYTYVLTPSEYGEIDLLTTLITLFVTVFSLNISEGILRFAIDKKYKNENILKVGLVICAIGTAILVLLYPGLRNITIISKYIPFFYILFIVQAIRGILKQYVKAIGETNIYVISDVVDTLIFVISNIILLVFYNKGVEGYIVSITIGYLIEIIIISCKINLVEVYKKGYFDRYESSRIIKYCIPLIVASMSWWIMNVSDRMLISHYLGVYYTGIYALALKIPSLITIINNMFFMAWQVSAIEEYEKEDISEFYSEVLAAFLAIMMLFCSILIMCIKMGLNIFVAPEFYSSWEVIPYLVIAALFSSLSNFINTLYMASKQTIGSMKNSFIGAILNIVLNIFLIQSIGIKGAAIATMISFGVMLLLMFKGTSKLVKLYINKKKIAIGFLVLILEIIVIYFDIGILKEMIINIFLVMTLLLIYRSSYMSFIKKVIALKSKK